MSIVRELKRRNVFRMAVLYMVAAWLIMQVTEVLITLVPLPHWIGTTVVWLLAIGFPISLIFSWFYEITPEGISLEKDIDPEQSIAHVTGRRLDFLVISLLIAAVILFAYDKWWMSGPPEKSIAVLPFMNMSNDPEQEFFSDGISEEQLNVLAKIPGLRVVARSSSFQFKGENRDIIDIGQQLNVAHVLEGSVRRAGSQLRITAQLIDTRDGFHLWSETYDRELANIFAVQDEIATAIGNVLKVKLALVGGEAVQPTVIKAASTDAYEAYLRGRESIHRRGRDNAEEAVRHLERSLRLDNNFAPAHAQLAIATSLLLFYGAYNLEEARRTTNSHLDRALELDPGLAEAHGGRALLATVTNDPASSIEHARKALASNPNYADAMNWLGIALLDLGRYEESHAAFKQMLLADPLTLVGRSNHALHLAQNGRTEEAHEMADQLLAEGARLGYFSHAFTSLYFEGKIADGLSWALKGHPRNNRVLFAFILAGEYAEARRINESETEWVDLAEGRFDEAIRETQRKLQLDPEREGPIGEAAYTLYVGGRIDEALPLYERWLAMRPEGRPLTGRYDLVSTMRLALARRKAGDEDGAQAVAQIARQDHAARRAVGRKNTAQDMAKAMIAGFEHNPDGAIAALKSAVQRGYRNPQSFDDLMFEDLRDDPRFVALRQELHAILDAEHDKVLQLICFDNPVPDEWQPLPETCEAVEEQRSL